MNMMVSRRTLLGSIALGGGAALLPRAALAWKVDGAALYPATTRRWKTMSRPRRSPACWCRWASARRRPH